MELGLKGKIALVTGSSRGIGRGIAHALAAEGSDVMLTGRDTAALEEAAAAIRKLGRRTAFAVVDLREKDAPAKLIEQTTREFGHLDILVNNAGATKRGDFLKLTDADWEDGYTLKFFGHMRLARLAWPMLRERHGALVAIGGVGAREPTQDFTIGSSVNGGVRVNCVQPGVVETDRTRRRIKAEIEKTGRSEQDIRGDIIREFRTTRIGTVEDIGEFVAFIVSARASWLHGTTIDLDGGGISVL
jgi:NAD(P)-dependent dehydrogenase (short-subunit alcohol dehydrogenase family)